MTYRVDESLRDFKAWSGGRDTIGMIEGYDSEHGTEYLEQLSDLADELFTEDSQCSSTNINDWLWFDVPELEEFADVFGGGAGQ